MKYTGIEVFPTRKFVEENSEPGEPKDYLPIGNCFICGEPICLFGRPVDTKGLCPGVAYGKMDRQ